MRKREIEIREMADQNIRKKGMGDKGTQINRREEEGLWIRTTEEVHCWQKRRGEIIPPSCTCLLYNALKLLCKAVANTFIFLFCTCFDRYTSRLQREDKGALIQAQMR